MQSTELHPNEIRDYIQRAPKRRYFDGQNIVNTTAARYKWLADIARGTLDERINRRAGIQDTWRPFCNPVTASVRRHHRNQLRKAGTRCMIHMV